MEDQRTTIEVTLPVCKAVVTMYEYLRNGDYRQIQKKLLSGVKIDSKKIDRDNPQNSDMDIDTSITVDIEDETVMYLVKSVKTADGNEVSDIRNFIYNLTITDGNFLRAEADKLSKGSSLTPELKKK